MTMDASQHERMSTEQLFRHYAPFVERFLLRLGVNESSIDDVVQEVFLVAHRSGGYMPGPAKPTTYLATIAVHAASAHRRAHKTRAARCASKDIDELVAPEHDPAQQLEARDSLRQLQSALDRLDDNLRTTLLMADAIGQTCPVIASAMDVPLGTVYWRLDRARKQFRAAWTTVSASKGTPRNGHADDSAKHTSRGRRASAVIVWWNGLWTRDEAREVLRTSCRPTAAELALARTLAGLRLPLPGAPLPSWASTLPSTTQVGSVLGAATLELASLTVAGVAAVALYTLTGARPESGVAVPRATAALASTTQIVSPMVSAPLAVTTAQPDSLLPSLPAPTVRKRTYEFAAAAVVLADTAPLPASRAVQSASRTGSTRARLAAHQQAASNIATSHPSSGMVAGTAAATTSAAHAAQLQASRSTTPPPAVLTQLAEAREVARAERMLASDPRGALRLLHALTTSASSQSLREERDYIEVMALFRSGQLRDARAATTRFLKSYPESAFAGAIVSTARRMSTDS